MINKEKALLDIHSIVFREKSFLPVKSARAMHTVLNSMLIVIIHRLSRHEPLLAICRCTSWPGDKIWQAVDPHENFEARM